MRFALAALVPLLSGCALGVLAPFVLDGPDELKDAHCVITEYRNLSWTQIDSLRYHDCDQSWPEGVVVHCDETDCDALLRALTAG